MRKATLVLATISLLQFVEIKLGSFELVKWVLHFLIGITLLTLSWSLIVEKSLYIMSALLLVSSQSLMLVSSLVGNILDIRYVLACITGGLFAYQTLTGRISWKLKHRSLTYSYLLCFVSMISLWMVAKDSTGQSYLHLGSLLIGATTYFCIRLFVTRTHN